MNHGKCPSNEETEENHVYSGNSLSHETAALDALNSVSPYEFRTPNRDNLHEASTGLTLDQTRIEGNFMPFTPSTSTLFDHSLGASAMLPLGTTATTLQMPSAQQPNGFSDFDLFIDSINGTYDDGLSSFYVDQPILPSPPAPLFPSIASQSQGHDTTSPKSRSDRIIASERRLFDEFTYTLPTFESSQTSRKEPWKVSQQDWESIFGEVERFRGVIPQGFFLPSRHTLTRYINTYFAGFHRHLPFIHSPTFSTVKCPVELLLAMATIGAISAFDRTNATMLFYSSLAICRERLHKRKKERCDTIFCSQKNPSALQTKRTIEHAPHLAVVAESEMKLPKEKDPRFKLLPLAQALLILMAMATWGNSETIFDEAIGIQHLLVNYMRTEKLLDPQSLPGNSNWGAWIQEEGFRRTISIIFCFFVFHTIVYDTPPVILNSELNIYLPSREKDWEAKSEDEWKEAQKDHKVEHHFQSIFTSLFHSQANFESQCSSLGSYTLILALIQHIYFLRAAAKRRPEKEQEVPSTDMIEVERALRNWQNGWNQDPESFLGPGSPLGPISFNATALLRMAYIRLNVDLGSWRALNTHDPHDIAVSIYRSPPLATNPRLARAVLYSAHALSIPVKIGVNIVAHNQAFSWSLQHSLCALECAFIISKWLIAIQPRVSEGTIDEEEARLYAYIEDMVIEAEAGGEIGTSSSDLCTRVVSIWARILSGTAHWNVVKMIGNILEAYAQILQTRPC